MSLVLTEEQSILQQSAAEFYSSVMPVTAFRQLRESEAVFDAETWSQMVELGWSSIMVPEELGGLEFGLMGMGILAIEGARTLAKSPLTTSAAVSVAALNFCKPSEQRDALLSALAAGEKMAAFAHLETTQFKPAIIRTQSASAADGYNVNGSKSCVENAQSSDVILMTARSPNAGFSESDGFILLIDPKADGIEFNSVGLIDEREYADISISDFNIAKDEKLEWNDDAAVAQVLDTATVIAACELYGCSLEAFERTLEYVKDREQFGNKIGSFQALQHRLAHQYTQLELLKTVVYDALSAVEKNRKDAALAVSHAKALANDTARLVTTEAIQMHGGIGITDELDIGLFYKRARVLRTMWGDSVYHRSRFASLSGY